MSAGWTESCRSTAADRRVDVPPRARWSAAKLDAHLADLRVRDKSGEPWYADYVRNDELVVVFRDAISIGGDPSTWAPAVEHGLELGIPQEQLDFKARTAEECAEVLRPPLSH